MTGGITYMDLKIKFSKEKEMGKIK